MNGLPDGFAGQLLDLTIPPRAMGTYRIIVGLVPSGTVPMRLESCIAGYVDEVTAAVRGYPGRCPNILRAKRGEG